MRFIACCMTSWALLAALTTQSWAAGRAYVIAGLIAAPGLSVIAERLRERGYIVTYGFYDQDREFGADACAHLADHIVVIGHSFGAERATKVATQAAACGARDVTMISVDPSAPAVVSGVAHAVNFVGELQATVAGAQNIPVPGFSHMGIMESPAMQERILEEAGPAGSQ